MDQGTKHLESNEGTKNDCGDVSVPEPLRFRADALLCKGDGVHSCRGDVEYWHLGVVEKELDG